MTQTGNIVRKSGVYAVGNALRGLTSFVMLPIYTRHLTPADYGVIELITVALDLLLLILGTRVAVGLYKFYSDAPDETQKKRTLSTTLVLVLAIHSLAALVLFAFRGQVAVLMDVTPDFGLALATYSLSAVFGAGNQVFFSYLKILDRASYFVGISLARLLLQLSLNIVLIVYLDMGYWGVVWSAVISSAILLLFFSCRFLPNIGLAVQGNIARNLVSFSAPIVASSLAMYYILFGSRYFLEHYSGTEEVGIYALAYRFGILVMFLVASPFGEYWNVRQFDMARLPDSSKLFGTVFFYFSLLLFVSTAGMLALVGDVVTILASQAYWSAIPVVPWLAAAYLLQALGDYFRFGSFYTSNNRFILYATFATVIAVSVFNFILIPQGGALGAAKALFFANIVRFFLLYIFSQRLFFMEVPWTRLGACVTYCGFVAFAVSLLEGDGISGFLLKAMVATLAFLVLPFTPLIDREHRRNAMAQIQLFIKTGVAGLFPHSRAR